MQTTAVIHEMGSGRVYVQHATADITYVATRNDELCGGCLKAVIRYSLLQHQDVSFTQRPAFHLREA